MAPSPSSCIFVTSLYLDLELQIAMKADFSSFAESFDPNLKEATMP